jgi:sugar phosphate isomerase/epimerase
MRGCSISVARRRKPGLLRRDRRSGARERVAITELSAHLQGQLVAVHPAYDALFDAFAAPEVRGNPKARQEWAVAEVQGADRLAPPRLQRRSRPFRARWPGPISIPGRSARRPDRGGLRRARPPLATLLDLAEENGVDIAFEIHPGEDLHDGITFEMFLDRVAGTRAPTCSTTRRTTCCRASTTSTISTSTATGSGCSTSRMPS